MKKFFTIFLVIMFALAPNGFAKDSKADEAKKIEEKKKKLELKKEDLKNSEWKVMITASEPKAKPREDVLIFKNGQISFKSFQERGFGPSNYTISLADDDPDMAAWETMQQGSKEGVVFIRGDWKANVMNGVISEQAADGKSSKEFRFSSATKAALVVEEPKKEEVKVEVKVPQATPSKETKNLDKKVK